MTAKPITRQNNNTNTSKAAQAKNASKPNKIGARKKLSYDMPQLENFFDVVFRNLKPDEFILGWSQNTNTPAYPKDLEDVLDKLDATQLAKACYFGTSTVVKAADGKLYNRKSQFSRLFVVVLDDIGTKVDKSLLPADLIPNYIIESSAGNYQYGFILETPIDNYELAEAFVHLVYTSGYGDTGGKMPTKVVRMPCGINGKEGVKGEFEVKLIDLNTDFWTPDELLDVLDVGVSWADVVADVNVAKQGKTAKFSGTSMWSPIKPVASSLNGVIDPVLEWLYETDRVVHDNGAWVKIQCPWGHEHSNGDTTSGYSPVGRGGEMSNVRGWHCFHDSCSDRNTSDFLKWVAEESGIYAPITDNVADLVADYVYVAAENAAYRIRGVNTPVGMKMEAFKNMHSKKVAVYDHRGEEKLIAEHALWTTSPSRLTVQGLMSDPSKRTRVIEYDGLRYLNTYSEPPWGKGEFNKQDVDTFKQFINYLIPNETERDYFLQWLAAKAQNPTFKGAAVLMVAPTQGTGRTTLTDMVTSLFTHNNVRKVSFPQLCAATDAGAFNDWLECGIVCCDEIMSHTQNKHKVYEGLKDLFDPRPKTMVINTKYGAQRSTTLYTSYLLLTNHVDAIGSLGDDRRVYVIQNTLIPNTPEYFDRLNAWLAEGKWTRNVWRWLQTLKPNLEMLHAPAPSTKGKLNMVNSTKSIADLLANKIEEFFCGFVPSVKEVENIAKSVLDFRLSSDAEGTSRVVGRIVKNRSQTLERRYYFGKKQTRVRVTNEYLKAAGIGHLDDLDEGVIETQVLDVMAKTSDVIHNDAAYSKFIVSLSEAIDSEDL